VARRIISIVVENTRNGMKRVKSVYGIGPGKEVESVSRLM
jgi:hypothetical protein